MARAKTHSINSIWYSIWKIVYTDWADHAIQETSEPVIENGAVLEEHLDPIAAFDYDDNQGGFGGFDDSYNDDFMWNINHKGIDHAKTH